MLVMQSHYLTGIEVKQIHGVGVKEANEKDVRLRLAPAIADKCVSARPLLTTPLLSALLRVTLFAGTCRIFLKAATINTIFRGTSSQCRTTQLQGALFRVGSKFKIELNANGSICGRL
jgi:hypothetical protein